LRGLAAAAHVGLEINLLRSVVAHGFIKQAGAMARNAPYFHREDLDRFLQRLYLHTTFDAEPSGDEASLIAATAACQCSTHELLHLIFEHDIPLRCPKNQDSKFGDFVISVGRVKTAIGLSAIGAISLSEAAGRLGVNTATIRNLVAAGYLQEVQKPHNSSER
ncbi:hypothetical protein, partial [Paracoccus sp. NSM]|uniref:hypothetical protein n=1 Tax=Paracoccus sp. NSM TaxID=3457784 RepID=UPI00403618FB